MKIYKYLGIVACVFFSTIASAQTPDPVEENWTQVTPIRGNFKFSFPSNIHGFIDTLNSLLYSKEIDTILNLQVYYIDNVTTNVAETDVVWQNILNQNSGDTLRSFAGVMLLLSEGTLEGIQDLPQNGNKPRGVEVGIRSPNDGISNYMMVSRIYYYNRKFLIFTASSTPNDNVRLGLYKTSFFNSIIFN